ncbi:ribonuclease domain-containing protein [Intrasporangium sp. DVR]|uniref:ribonuclease domain-containing protein n=1 Tax=Intrasporangium sp. DVR TaxID=3127867 RepID=UPI00313A6604
MRDTTRRPLLLVLLVVSVVLAVWLVARAAGPGQTGAGPVGGPLSRSATVTSGAEPTQRHTASSEPTDGTTDPASGLPWIEESDLPPEARDTLALIAAGGPFPYPRSDNQTFQNRERLLPAQPRGYYREFTVETPGSDDRGPRRIITGAAGEKYWTDDHYASFSRIREGP